MIAEDTLKSRLPSSQLPSRKALPPFEALRAFDAVARLGGVRKAAQYLCRDHAVVSRHLRAIEEWTGMKLIERTPGGAVLTEEGVRYHREIATAMDIIAGATIDLMKRGDDRCLHIRCMPGFALHWLSASTRRLREGQPEHRTSSCVPPIAVPNSSPMRRTSRSASFPPTAGRIECRPNCAAIKVARTPIIAVASKEYLAGRAADRASRATC